jgi:hypothetical protein
LQDVIRTRISQRTLYFESVAKRIPRFFKDIKPATGFYEISKLVATRIFAEIEFTALIA